MSVKSSKIGDLKRSSDFFLRGGDLFFLVGDVYYKVNSVFFERESPIFAALVKNWDIPDAQAKGASLSTALILENVSVTQFERFLWVFYNRQFSPYDAPLDAWKDILDLAHRWEFGEVKKLAVRQLHSIRGIHPVDRIVLYKDYDVDEEYIIPLYAKLIVRDEPLSQRESQKLGVDTTVLIFQARERLRTQEQDGLKSPLPTDVNDAEVMRVVAQLFGSDNASEEDSFAGFQNKLMTASRKSLRPQRSIPFTPISAADLGVKAPDSIKRSTPSDHGHSSRTRVSEGSMTSQKLGRRWTLRLKNALHPSQKS